MLVIINIFLFLFRLDIHSHNDVVLIYHEEFNLSYASVACVFCVYILLSFSIIR